MATEYVLSIPAPHTHLVEVEMRIPAPPDPLELVMPVWAPGSYLIREFPRNVQDLEAHDASGLRLRCVKRDKCTWRIEGDPVGPVTVHYRVYANELSVRTSHVDASHAFVSGSSVFMWARGTEGEGIRLRVEAPDGWRVATSLEETVAGTFVAQDYDELVDSPLEIGPHRTLAWTQEGLPHRYVIWGAGEVDEQRLLADTRRIIEVCSAMFGGLPYQQYLFILQVVPEGRGGLEHRSSTALQVPRSAVSGPEYESLIALVAHEFFHVWLGKRIRPESLGPFDYTGENYTRHLWVVEGFTTYYTDLILVRAGLMTPTRYLERLGDSIARLQALPGRRRQSLEESSFDAWIKFYRPDPNTPNAQVSYYHKGALVALALDLEIRRRSGGVRSLDDVMRLLWERWGMPDVGFPEAEGIRAVVEEVYGGPLDRRFAAYVEGTEEIDFDAHLEAAGLELRAYGAAGVEAGPLAKSIAAVPPVRPAPPTAAEWRLGMRVTEIGGRVRVTHVLAGLPAYDAGVNAGDEVLAVDWRRANAAVLNAAATGADDGDTIELHLVRREVIQVVRVTVRAETPRLARIVPIEGASEVQVAVRDGWLGGGGAAAGGQIQH